MRNTYQSIEVKCIKEALDADGVKIMQFTKDKTYAATQVADKYEMYWAVEDDNGNDEKFFNLNIMFEII